jgi:hypothetical protein
MRYAERAVFQITCGNAMIGTFKGFPLSHIDLIDEGVSDRPTWQTHWTFDNDDILFFGLDEGLFECFR